MIEILTYLACGVAVLSAISSAWDAHQTGKALKKLRGRR